MKDTSDITCCTKCKCDDKIVAKHALLTRAVVLFTSAIATYIVAVLAFCVKHYNASAILFAVGLIPFTYGISYYIKFKTFKETGCICRNKRQVSDDENNAVNRQKLPFTAVEV
ncbi:hypothetical protein [Mucilaginibacter lacusdianchii]|uniref:hypothetical protein n=1 Tax=Mucilaginibacter lacusdianchii TaxID=2684211 RepID=UPI00131C4CA4|nr:hypothetical protein [Mucilaginibacter sp. JXJ CY 39]